jgi:drug/metabolite transporter (DMT)-like permease
MPIHAAVKVFYQLGLEDPLLVAILFIFGHALSFPLYFVAKWLSRFDKDLAQQETGTYSNEDSTSSTHEEESLEQDHVAQPTDTPAASSSPGTCTKEDDPRSHHHRHHAQGEHVEVVFSGFRRCMTILAASRRESIVWIPEEDDDDDAHKQGRSPRATPGVETSSKAGRDVNTSVRLTETRTISCGSVTGLHSTSGIAWVHTVPHWFRPVVPGILNLTNTVCRMMALVYVSATVSEMMISGLELVFSVVASKFIRRRRIPIQRWVGVAIVLVGLFLVGGANFVVRDHDSSTSEETSHAKGSTAFGFLFIIGKVVSSVAQDLSEEIFMQEADFPATLLLGIEGILGSLIAIPLYIGFGQYFQEDPGKIFESIAHNTGYVCYIVFLVFIFYAGGIFQIMSTGVTSSMTRNVWKNFRGVVVWVISLTVYYSSAHGEYGEAWSSPESPMVLLGFLVMMIGTIVYYRQTTNK